MGTEVPHRAEHAVGAGFDRRGVVAGAVLAVALAIVGFVRHDNFWSEFDLAIFDQAAWQLSHGRAHVSLIERSIFADHFSPVILLFAPLYRLTATPFWLLAVQALALGATVLPMRAIARELGTSELLGTVFVLSSAPLLASAVFDFHPSTLAVPFVALAVLGAIRDDRRTVGIAAIAVIVCRADLAWALLGVAIVAGRRTRYVLASLSAVGVGLGYAVPAITGPGGSFEAHYSHLGSGVSDVLLHPWRLVPAGFDPDTLSQLGMWLLPVAFLTVFRPRWLLAVVVAAFPVLLSQWPGTKLPWHHYGAPYVPLVIGGALAGYAWITATDRKSAIVARLPIVVAACVVLGLLLSSPISPSAPRSQRVWTVMTRSNDGDPAAAADAVRDGDAVGASYYLVAHLAHRRTLYLLPLPFEPLATTLPPGLAPEPRPSAAEEIDVVVSDDETPDLPAGFRVVADLDGYVVLRRNASDR